MNCPPGVRQSLEISGTELLSNGERIFAQWVGNVAPLPFQHHHLLGARPK